MPSKTHSDARIVTKRRGKGFSKPAGFKSINKKTVKQLPDTSRIPWFPTTTKTSRDN